MRDTAVFYASWFEASRDLPADEFKELFLAIADYAFEDKEPAYLPIVSQAIFTLARPIVKKNNEKWQAKKEAGRPKIDLTAEECKSAINAWGSAKAAAQHLGVSLRTLYNRLSVQKCKNANSVNVNANVNVNVNDVHKDLCTRAAIPNACGKPTQYVFPLERTKRTGEELTQASRIFAKLPFRREYLEMSEDRVAKKGEPQEAEAQRLHDFISDLANEAEQKGKMAKSDSAKAVYLGQKRAYEQAQGILASGDYEVAKKQLEWRENQAFKGRSSENLSLDTRSELDGAFKAYRRALQLLDAFTDQGKKRLTAYNGDSVCKNFDGETQKELG